MVLIIKKPIKQKLKQSKLTLTKIDRPHRIVFFGRYDSTYPRNAILRDGLKRNGFVVEEANLDYKVYRNRIVSIQRWLPRIMGAVVAEGLRIGGIFYLILRYACKLIKSSIWFVPEFCFKETVLLAPLAWLLRKKIVFDPLVSGYDTAVLDRNEYNPESFFARYIRIQDRLSLRTSDLVIFDTATHEKYFKRLLGVKLASSAVIPVGFNSKVFIRDLFSKRNNQEDTLNVAYWGTVVPLHGIDRVVRATQLVQKESNIRFHFFLQNNQDKLEFLRNVEGGDGTLPTNVTVHLHRIMDDPSVLCSMGAAIGIFGTSQKAGNVISSKIYEAMSLGIPVFTADTKAIREFFTDGRNIVLCELGCPESLSDKLLYYCKHRAELLSIGLRAKNLVWEKFEAKPLGSSLGSLLKAL